MPEVYEDAHVGVLMDVNQRLNRINTIAQGNGRVKYGEGWNDIPRDNPEHNGIHARNILAAHPDVWYDVLRANLMMATEADSREMLESIALQVAAIATAWAADIRQRPTN